MDNSGDNLSKEFGLNFYMNPESEILHENTGLPNRGENKR
jgi:hypothetical protein